MSHLATTGSKSAFGRAVASARALRGLSIASFARMCGMAPSTLGGFETGRRPLDAHSARRIVAVLKASPEEQVRIADGWAAAAETRFGAGYGCTPNCSAGHRAMALLSIMGPETSPIAWGRIERIVLDDLAARTDAQSTPEAAA